MNFISRRKFLKNVNYLEMTPIRQIEHIVTDKEKSADINKPQEQTITLLVPKFRNKWLSNFLFHNRPSQYIYIHLDEFGTSVWLMIDGKLNVGQICHNLIDKYGEKVMPAEERVPKFLTKLYDNRLISYKQLLER